MTQEYDLITTGSEWYDYFHFQVKQWNEAILKKDYVQAAINELALEAMGAKLNNGSWSITFEE